MSKSSGNTYKIYFILYLAVILELLLVIVERDDAEDDLKKQKSNIEQAFVTFLTGLAQPPEATTRQEVLKIYADADEGSGIINKKTFSDTSFYITIRGVHDLETLKSIELIQALMVPLSGKASREPRPDSIVKRELDLANDSLNSNYVKIHFDRRFLELDGKDTVLRVPVTINFDRTGFYKFKFDYYLDKLTFVPNANNPDSIKLGNITAAFHIVYNMERFTKLGPKILEGEKNYQPAKLEAIVKELNNQWNRAENILILQIIDSSIPEPERPPKVQVHTP